VNGLHTSQYRYRGEKGLPTGEERNAMVRKVSGNAG